MSAVAYVDDLFWREDCRLSSRFGFDFRSLTLMICSGVRTFLRSRVLDRPSVASQSSIPKKAASVAGGRFAFSVFVFYGFGVAGGVGGVGGVPGPPPASTMMRAT